MFTKLKSNKGFTIVETLIVLAIAAVIIIIVLLAVPALQRTARNNTIKTDASHVAGAISTFESDNNGALPNHITASGSTLSVSALTSGMNCGAAAGAAIAAESNNIGAATTVGCDTMVVTAVTYNASTTGALTSTTPTVSPGNVLIVAGQSCTVTGTLTPAGRSFAVFYPVETGGAAGSVGCVTG